MTDVLSGITAFLLCHHELWCKHVWHSFEDWYNSLASDAPRQLFADQFSAWIQSTEDVEMGIDEYEFIIELLQDKTASLKVCQWIDHS